MSKYVLLNFRVSDGLFERINDRAWSLRKNRSVYIRGLIEKDLKISDSKDVLNEAIFALELANKENPNRGFVKTIEKLKFLFNSE